MAFAWPPEGTYAVILAFRAVALDSAPFDPWIIETTTPTSGAIPVLNGLTSLHGLLANIGVWNHVAVDFNLDNTSIVDGGLAVQGTITVNGQSPKIVTLHPPLLSGDGTRTLSLGVASTAAVFPAKLRFDNVTYSHAAP